MTANEKILFTLKYDSPFIAFSLLLKLTLFIFSILMLIFIKTHNIYSLFLFMIAVYSIFTLIEMGLFKKLTITNSKITKEWYFYKKIINIDKNTFARRTSNPISIKRLYFGSKKNKFISYLFIINVRCISNSDEKMQELKEVLIKLNIIKEDTCGWYYGY